MPKFKPGQSGNLNGRPKNRTPATILRKQISEDMPEIICTLIRLAKGGDVAAAKVLIDRVCPPLKAQSLPVALPVADSLTEQGNEVIEATMRGQISPDIGSQLLGALANQAKLVEIDELAIRVKALEDQYGFKDQDQGIGITTALQQI